MRCQTLSSRFCVRGFDSPSESLVSASSKRFGEALDDATLLGGALLGEAVQAHLLGVVGQYLVQMHAVTRCGLDAHRRLGVEVPGAFPADHQVAVALLTQPLDAVLGGDAAVHHHQGGARGVERVEHLGQRVMFAHVAGEDLRAAHEAAGIEHQPQGEERTIGAFFLGVSASCLGLPARLAFEIGIGQVVKRDRRGAGRTAPSPGRTDGARWPRGAPSAHRRRDTGASVPSLRSPCPSSSPRGAAFAQPAPGGALRARACHARDDRADGGGA